MISDHVRHQGPWQVMQRGEIAKLGRTFRLRLARLLGCGLCSYAGLLELGQYAVPGRHPALAVFSASSLEALMGIAVITAIRRSRFPFSDLLSKL